MSGKATSREREHFLPIFEGFILNCKCFHYQFLLVLFRFRTIPGRMEMLLVNP